MRVIVLFALAIAAAAAFPANPQRIIGGSVTTISEYPSMVALLYSSDLVNYSQACGGSLLNRRSILTAAHCVYGSGANRWRSRVGSSLANSGGIVYPTSPFNIFPNYNSRSRDNDIAILRTATTIVLNENATAVSIAGSNYNLADNQVVWAAGWGYTSEGGSSSEQLLHVQIWTINQVTCKVIYPSLTENMLCSGWLDVGGRDQCQGDSGGPLYHNGIQVGIASFGEGCGLPLFPGVNTRVSRYTNWITSNA